MQNLLVLSIPLLLGVLIVFLLWQDETQNRWMIKLLLSIGVGLGCNSLLYFIYLCIIPSQQGYLVLQLLLLLLLLLLLIFVALYQKRIRFDFHLQEFFSFSWKDFPALVVTIFVIILASITFFIIAKRNLYGEWDAWMMYNRTARFIFRGGLEWKNAFSPQLSWNFHADYPPLIALSIASSWAIIGKEYVFIPVMVGGLFFVASAGLLFAGIATTKTWGQAILALGSLLAVTDFIRMGAAQMAEVPLSFFMLATTLLFYLNATKKNKTLFVLAGITAGLAAWTKNEGVLFVLVSFFALLVVYCKEMRTSLPWYLLGLLLPMALLIFFKLNLAPANDLFTHPVEQLKQVLDIKRHQAILQSFIQSFRGWGNWVALILYGTFMGIKIEEGKLPVIKIILIILVLQVTGYYTILLLTPHDLAWHLSTAASRILLQVAPIFFFLYFSLFQSPESIFKSS